MPTAPRTQDERRRVAVVEWLGALGMLAVLAVSAPARAELSPVEVIDLYSESKRMFADARALAPRDPVAAHALFDQSVLRLQRILDEGDIRNGYLYYNIGNAHMLKGDLGRAILNYRRAEPFIPDDRNLSENLAYARGKVMDKIPLSTEKSVLRTIFFFHYEFSPTVRLVFFAGFFNAIWVLLLLRLFGVFNSAPRVALASLGLLSALLLASLVVENLSDGGSPRGVIVATEVVGRRGEATTYEPSFTEPLHAGVEFTFKERRDGWWLIELDDERETWLPSSAVGVVARP
jgi:hypothetical protein